MQEHCIIPPSCHCVHMRFLLHSSCLSWHIPRRQAGESMKKHDHPHLGSTTLKYRLEKGILSELLPFRQWVVWRYQLVNNQWKKSRSILSTAEQQKPMPEERGVPFHRLSTGWKQESITASVLSFQTKTLLPALIDINLSQASRKLRGTERMKFSYARSIHSQEASDEQYITGEFGDGDDFEPARQGLGTRHGLCATLDGPAGWTDLCANDGLDVDASSASRLCTPAHHGRQLRRVGEQASHRATRKSRPRRVCCRRCSRRRWRR
jgi:hypothetical protein